MSSTRESLLCQLERAWNARDPMAIGNCFLRDARCEWHALVPDGASPCLEGRAAIARCAAQLFRASPDLELAFPVISYGRDRRIWAEWSLSARGADRSRSFVGVAVFSLSELGFTRAHLYGDPLVFRRGTRRSWRDAWRIPGRGAA